MLSLLPLLAALPLALAALPLALAALPLALAAPTCSLKPSTASASAPSATPTSTPPSGNPGAGTNGTIVMSWFADWRSEFGVSNINWTHYTHMAYFAGEPSADGTVSVPASSVDQFTAAAIANGVKPILTVGGWDTSIYWSSSVATSQNRTTFVNSLAQYAYEHNFAGLDFDWEYPNKQGVGCNTISPQDSANFLSFLQEMRQAAPNLTLSAAASIVPWNDENGTPLTNVSAYDAVLDWVEMMNYDVFGTFSSVTGPNSPLNDTCAPTADQQGSAISGVTAWTNAGLSPSKLVLGVASYGHAFTVTPSTAVTNGQLNIYTSFDKTNIPIGDSWDPPSTSPDICGNPPVGNGNSGIYHFWALIQDNFINQDGSFASGMTGLYDDCTQTPFVYDSSNSILVSFDNQQSFTAKGQYVKANGLGGIAMYETGGDYQGALIQAITTAMA